MEIDRMPQEFWDDKDWAFANYETLMEKYPNQWIAVVGKEVIAAGTNIGAIRTTARERTGRKYIPIIYIERGSHVY